MADTTITSANSVFTLTCPGVFNAPFQLVGYSAEKAWSSDTQEIAETQMGVDGRATSGYTPALVPQSISLQADSPSTVYLDAIAAAMKTQKDVYYLQGTISLPGPGTAFVCKKGTLKGYKTLPDASKVLQPREFQIVWEDIQSTIL